MKDRTGFSEKTYRRKIVQPHLHHYRVQIQQTDLWISTETDLSVEAREKTLECRNELEAFVAEQPEFLHALSPWLDDGPAPEIVRRMIHAGRCSGVGPMAAVAGAIAEAVGLRLTEKSPTVIVENGGDIFVVSPKPIVAAIFAGKSPLSMKIGVRIDHGNRPFGLCTSSGTVGHSISFGHADAVCVYATSCPLADAAATAIANRVQTAEDISSAIAFGRTIEGIQGILIVVGRKIGAWGGMELVPVVGKRC